MARAYYRLKPGFKPKKMRILLIGYGKMGKAIEQIALQRGHNLAYIIDRANSDLLYQKMHRSSWRCSAHG